MSELTVDVEHLPEHGAFLVRTVGPLTSHSRHQLRRAVLKCLTECPAAVIIDLTGAYLVDRIAAAVFVTLRRDANGVGAGVNVIVCGATDQLLAQRIRALDRGQAIFCDLGDAIRGMHDGPPVSRWLFRRLPEGILAPIDAGVTIADACTRWGLVHLAFPARAAMLDLFLTVRGCPPGELRMSATCPGDRLLIGIRTPSSGTQPSACAQLRPPPGFFHRATRTSHICWTALSTAPPELP
jgi:anti-anti-sigma regulatory factor